MTSESRAWERPDGTDEDPRVDMLAATYVTPCEWGEASWDMRDEARRWARDLLARLDAAAPVAKDRRLVDLHAQAEAWVNENAASRKSHPDSPTHHARRVALEEAANTVLNVVEGRLTGLAEHYARQSAPVAREDTASPDEMETPASPRRCRCGHVGVDHKAGSDRPCRMCACNGWRPDGRTAGKDAADAALASALHHAAVRRAVTDADRPAVAPGAQRAAPTRDDLVECGRSDEETCSESHEHVDHRVGHTASVERAHDAELHERVVLAFRWAYAVTVRSVGAAYRTDIEWRQPSRAEAERMADVALGVLRGGGADGGGEDEGPQLTEHAEKTGRCSQCGKPFGESACGPTHASAACVYFGGSDRVMAIKAIRDERDESAARIRPAVEDAQARGAMHAKAARTAIVARLARAAGVSPDSEDVVGEIEAAIRALHELVLTQARVSTTQARTVQEVLAAETLLHDSGATGSYSSLSEWITDALAKAREPEVITGAEAQAVSPDTVIVDQRDLEIGAAPPTRKRWPGPGHMPSSWSDGWVPVLAREYQIVHRPAPAPAPLQLGDVVTGDRAVSAPVGTKLGAKSAAVAAVHTTGGWSVTGMNHEQDHEHAVRINEWVVLALGDGNET